MASSISRLAEVKRGLIKHQKTTDLYSNILDAASTALAFGATQAKRAKTAWGEYETGYKELGGEGDIGRPTGFFKSRFGMPEGEVDIGGRIYDREKITKAGRVLGSDIGAMLDEDARTRYMGITAPGRDIPTIAGLPTRVEQTRAERVEQTRAERIRIRRELAKDPSFKFSTLYDDVLDSEDDAFIDKSSPEELAMLREARLQQQNLNPNISATNYKDEPFTGRSSELQEAGEKKRLEAAMNLNITPLQPIRGKIDSSISTDPSPSRIEVPKIRHNLLRTIGGNIMNAFNKAGGTGKLQHWQQQQEEQNIKQQEKRDEIRMRAEETMRRREEDRLRREGKEMNDPSYIYR